jgi:hypothetical protein
MELSLSLLSLSLSAHASYEHVSLIKPFVRVSMLSIIQQMFLEQLLGFNLFVLSLAN